MVAGRNNPTRRALLGAAFVAPVYSGNEAGPKGGHGATACGPRGDASCDYSG